MTPQDLIQKVIEVYDRYLNNDRITPSPQGKRAFFQAAVVRDNFLPEDLQREIDARRGQTSQEEYLLAFAGRYSIYR